MDVKDLNRQGHSVRAIARITGHSRNTVRALLRQKTPQSYKRGPRPSCLDPYKAYIEQRYKECALSAVRLFEEVRPMGYSGGYDVLRRYVQTLAPMKRALEAASVRFETPPGAQAQADWAYCGRFADVSGREVPIYVFVMVLGFSRYMYVEFTTSMKLPVLMACHKNAFEYFGGWTKSILYDNMKQVKISYGVWNAQFLDFANYYGFTPKTHRIYRPRTKGKVERQVDYIRDNFLNGRSFAGLIDLNAQGRHWLEHTANVRVHGTTGQAPAQMLGQEALSPITSIRPYQVPEVAIRKVDRESFVHLAGSRYSVPPAHVGATVEVRAYGQTIVIRSADLIIAEHARAEKPGLCVADKEHVAQLWRLAMAETAPPKRGCHVTFEQEVATTPLSLYDACAADQPIVGVAA